jgi:P-type E1-E2 ATPase
VIRNGKEKLVAGREVVRGDILVLQEGDRVPADAQVLSTVSLSVHESLLTGESVPSESLGAQLARPEVFPAEERTLMPSSQNDGSPRSRRCRGHSHWHQN